MDEATADAVYETVARQSLEIIELRRAYTSLLAQYERTARQLDALRSETRAGVRTDMQTEIDADVHALA